MKLEQCPSGLYADFTREEYLRAIITSYSGGTTWLRIDGLSLAVGGLSPVDILKTFRQYPTETVRGSVHNSDAHSVSAPKDLYRDWQKLTGTLDELLRAYYHGIQDARAGRKLASRLTLLLASIDKKE